MNLQTPISELNSRMNRFRQLMDIKNPDWKIAVIFSRINLLYCTGSMPEGLLMIERDKEANFWVRRSYERTLDESLFANIKPMDGFRDVAVGFSKLPDTVYLETEFIPLAMYQRFQKYFPFAGFKSLDYQLACTRAVKSPYEMQFMEQAGAIHQRVLELRVPELLHHGISELEFAGELYKVMLEEGHQGAARFNMFDTEMAVGQIGFGESSIYPTSFNGPGGNYGLNPAMPGLGSRERKLTKGDLVFVDIGLAYNGYHSDKTMTYMFGQTLPDEALIAHQQCVDLQHKIAAMLMPGNIPSVIYETIMAELSSEFLENFMGYGNRQVKFLGHGIGLTIDEIPVLAKGFNEPLQENMCFAVEPKKGIKNIGMVGIENTFVATPHGGRCLSGNHPGLMLVK
jgi:Xaa-Pro aminopeptidase